MTPPNTAIRDRLKTVQEQKRDLLSRRAEARKERDAAKEAFANADFSENGDAKIYETDEFKAAEDAVKKVGLLEDEIEDLTVAEQGLLRMVGDDQPDPASKNGNGRTAAATDGQRGWNGHRLLAESEAFRAAAEAGIFTSGARFGTVSVGEIVDRDAFFSALPTAPANSVGTDQGAIVPDVRGIISPALGPLSILDIIPTGTTDSNIVQFVQVTALPGYAAEVGELQAKPEEGMTLQDATAPVRTIAGWAKLARQAMDDVAGLGTLINTLLPWDVRRRLQGQMLAGDGTGQNLLGILNTTGIGAPASAAGDNIADGILRAMTTVILSDQEPNFAAINPITWQDLLMMKTTYGDYIYGNPGQVTTPVIWGLRITANRYVPQASPLVGDAMGATLLVREGVNVKVSDADQDDFIKNRVTVLAETRVAFPIWRPSAFAVAPLGGS